MDSLWTCNWLAGTPEYEELKTLTGLYNSQRFGNVKPVFLEKLNLLLHQLSVISQKDIQLKFLTKVLTWFKKHSGKLEPQPVKQLSPLLPKAKPIKIKKQQKSLSQSRQLKNSVLEDWRFLKGKQKKLIKWGIEKSRSDENFLYKLETKSISHERNGKKRNISSSFHLKNLKKVYKKHKKLINPLFFDFEKQDYKEKLPALTPNMKEFELVKRALSKKGIHVASKIMEPLNFYDSPVKPLSCKFIEQSPAAEYFIFPQGGESLLRKKS
jgi:hypothetical protein